MRKGAATDVRDVPPTHGIAGARLFTVHRVSDALMSLIRVWWDARYRRHHLARVVPGISPATSHSSFSERAAGRMEGGVRIYPWAPPGVLVGRLITRGRGFVETQRSASRRLMRTAELWLAPIIKRIFYVLSFDLLVRDLTRPLPSGRLHHRDLVLQRIAMDERPWWEGLMSPKALKQVRAALADGDVASVALLRGRIVGQAWATRVTKGDVRVRLAADEAYIYGLGTDARYRSMGTALAVMSELLSSLACDGVSRVYGYVDRRNRTSQVVHRTLLGFVQVQQARRVRLFRRWGFVIPGSVHPASGPLVTSSRLRLPWAQRTGLTVRP